MSGAVREQESGRFLVFSSLEPAPWSDRTAWRASEVVPGDRSRQDADREQPVTVSFVKERMELKRGSPLESAGAPCRDRAGHIAVLPSRGYTPDEYDG